MNTRQRDGRSGDMRSFLFTLLLVLPSLAHAQYTPSPRLVPLDPAVVAYESQLHARLGYLGQQDYLLRHDDDARRHRRHKIMAITFGAVGGVGLYLGLMGLALIHVDERGRSPEQKALAGSVVGSFAALALSGIVLGLHSAFTRPHRQEYRQIRLEQRDIRRELKRLHGERTLQVSLDGFALRF